MPYLCKRAKWLAPDYLHWISCLASLKALGASKNCRLQFCQEMCTIKIIKYDKNPNAKIITIIIWLLSRVKGICFFSHLLTDWGSDGRCVQRALALGYGGYAVVHHGRVVPPHSTPNSWTGYCARRVSIWCLEIGRGATCAGRCEVTELGEQFVLILDAPFSRPNLERFHRKNK